MAAGLSAGALACETCCDICRAFKFLIAFLVSVAAIALGIFARWEVTEGLQVFGEEQYINSLLDNTTIQNTTNLTESSSNPWEESFFGRIMGHGEDLKEKFNDLPVDDKIRVFTTVLLIVFAVVAIVNILSLIVSLGAWMTECCCKPLLAKMENPCCTLLCECICGPLPVCVIQFLILLSQLFAHALSYIFFLAALIIAGLGEVCELGTPGIEALQGFLQTIKFLLANKEGVDYFSSLNVTVYCEATQKVGRGGLWLFLACFIAIISQTLMLAVLSEEKAHLVDEIILQEEEANEANIAANMALDDLDSDLEGRADDGMCC